MTRRPPLPPQLGPIFSTRDARSAGVSASRLRASDLAAPFPGSRVIAEGAFGTVDVVNRCRAFIPVAPVSFCFSHVTAALLLRIPLPFRLQRRAAIDVSVLRGSPAVRVRGVIGHRSTMLQGVMVDGLPVLAPELVWLQLAPLLTLDELVVAGDHLVRRKRPASTMAALAAAVHRHGRARGIISARAALGDIRSGTDSPKESETRLIIVRAGLPEPIIGHEVHDTDGFFVGTPDLAYVRERVALDYEGDHHRTDKRTFRDDIERKEQFADAEWRYIRITDDHLQQPHRLVNRVARVLASSPSR